MMKKGINDSLPPSENDAREKKVKNDPRILECVIISLGYFLLSQIQRKGIMPANRCTFSSSVSTVYV